ncbi:MAG: transglycosylase SLT domain-containing protein [Firmicutes bacterium]|jgi:hypothetical protein|nr:transglycosylase SLT domain-containing protein [Bacillota bacterium]
MDIMNKKVIIPSMLILALVVCIVSFTRLEANVVVGEEVQVVEKIELVSDEEVTSEIMARPLEAEQQVEIDSDEMKALEIAETTPLDVETARIIVDYSNQFEINTSLILAIIDLESNFKQYEVGGAKDRGYMQIIPGTEKWLANEYGHKIGIEYDPERIFDAEYNIGLGVIYIDLLQNAYGNNYSRILSEYNRGPYSLKKYYEKNKTYSTKYSKVVLSREKKYLALND